MLMPEIIYTAAQRSQLASREDRVSADRTNDALIELAQLKDPRTIWIRLQWIQKPDRENDCCGGGIYSSEDAVVLRFKTQPFPSQLAEFIDPRKEWKDFGKDLDEAMRLRQPCISKCCSIVTFILLFYLTIIGIFFYMCAEVGCAQRGRKRSKKALNDVIEKWNDKWKSKGIEIIGRFHPDRDEGEDMPDEDSFGEFQYLCIKLPQPPASFFAQQQAYQMQLIMQQQQMQFYAMNNGVIPMPTAPPYQQQQIYSQQQQQQNLPQNIPILNPLQVPGSLIQPNYQQIPIQTQHQPHQQQQQQQFYKQEHDLEPTSPTSGDPTI
jgi:hypothetical protein